MSDTVMLNGESESSRNGVKGDIALSDMDFIFVNLLILRKGSEII